MKQLNTEEIKKELVNMMVVIDDFCKKHQIKYSLGYGSLLGAVRHKGFIPWDDDLDIMMTRDNYNKFIVKWETINDGLKLLTNEDPDYNLMFCKVYNPKIQIKLSNEDRYQDKQHLFIDIFPIDYLSDTIEEGKKIIHKSNFSLCLLIAAQWKHFYINKRHSFFRQMPRFVFFILSRLVNSKKIVSKLNKNIHYTRSKYCYCIALNRAKYEIFETRMFDEYIEVEYEKHIFMSIKDYDNNLRIIYGDYMKLPPKNKRSTPHSYIAYYLYD